MDNGDMELLLDVKPTGSISDFVEALDNCTQRISAVHVHRIFMKELKAEEQAAIFDCFHNLNEISISFVTIPMALVAKVILRSQRLQKISLDRVVLISDPSNAQDDVFFSALQGLDSLEDFHFALSTTGTAPEGQKLSFQADHELDTLFQSLSGIQALKKVFVSVGPNTVGRANVRPQTLEALLSNASVEDLALVNFPLHTQHCQAIVEAGSQLESLSLLNAECGNDGATVLANALQQHEETQLTNLRKLCLPGNNITNAGGARLAKALTTGQSKLEVLDLHANQLTKAFGSDLAALLEQNTSLRFLDVSNNKLGDKGVQAIATALRNHNTTLEQLNLFDTQLTNASCHAFAGALRNNTTLKKLNLYNNTKIDATGVQTLASALEFHNYTLERLEVTKKSVRGVDESGLDLFLKLNRDFKRGTMLASNLNEVEYVEGMAAAKNDVSSIFYFLQAKPSLCC